MTESHGLQINIETLKHEGLFISIIGYKKNYIYIQQCLTEDCNRYHFINKEYFIFVYLNLIIILMTAVLYVLNQR